MSKPAATTPRHILIVDDDPDFLAQQELLLTAAGHTVSKAASRPEAEAYLVANRPDAAIVDLMMDDSDDGFALCYKARKLYPDLPILIVTGVAHEAGMEFDAQTREERDWIKADAILPKPVRAEQVHRELDRILNQKR